jgi:selenoprotein W-related protein
LAAGARVEIEYCARCRFLARAAWTAQELLTTFADELGEVALVPGAGGVFQVRVGGELVWCRRQEGRFPELAELKRRVRDRVAPGKSLGHSDAGE